MRDGGNSNDVSHWLGASLEPSLIFLFHADDEYSPVEETTTLAGVFRSRRSTSSGTENADSTSVKRGCMS